MKCEQALALLDALPFVSVEAAKFVSLEAHLDSCAQCRKARDEIESLSLALSRIPEPAPFEDLTASVLGRIAEVSAVPQEEKVALKEESGEQTVTPRAFGSLSDDARSRGAQWWGWTVLPVGLALAFGAEVYRMATGQAPLRLTEPLIQGGLSFADLPAASPSLWILVAGLLLCTVGLFTPTVTELDVS